jgi:hypothetical protein
MNKYIHSFMVFGQSTSEKALRTINELCADGWEVWATNLTGVQDSYLLSYHLRKKVE